MGRPQEICVARFWSRHILHTLTSHLYVLPVTCKSIIEGTLSHVHVCITHQHQQPAIDSDWAPSLRRISLPNLNGTSGQRGRRKKKSNTQGGISRWGQKPNNPESEAGLSPSQSDLYGEESGRPWAGWIVPVVMTRPNAIPILVLVPIPVPSLG